MFPFDSNFRPAPKPAVATPKPAPAITTVAKATPPPTVVNVARFTDGMMSDRLSQAKANAYKLGFGGGPGMNWVDPPGTGPTGPVWPRGPLTPDGGKVKQPGVDVMQDKLVSLGYLDGSLITDDTRGLYGNATQSAVRDFQIANGIRPVTGIADEATLARMGSSSAISKADALAATPESPVIGPSIGTEGPAPVPTMNTLQLPPRTGTVRSDGFANVRGDPSTNNKAIGQVANGTQLNIVGEQGDWLHVTGTGRNGPIDGWINKSLVNELPRQDPRVAARMESLGYIQPGGQVDDMAVHNFQAMNGLPVGPMDDATLSAMWSSDAKVNTHVMQFTNGRWNPTGPSASNNCGPASVAMALGAAGLITIDPANPEAAIDASRAITGGTRSDTTGSTQLTNAVTQQGGQAYPITNMDEVQMAVSSGDPVVLFGYEQKNTDYRGAHWVAVVGYDKATDTFLVSDPLASDGVQRWSRADMEAYANFSVDSSVAVHNPNG